jgi:hypothetical protein
MPRKTLDAGDQCADYDYGFVGIATLEETMFVEYMPGF